MCIFITGGNFFWTGGAVSAFSLVVIAVERYFAVVRHLNKRHRLTTRRLVAIITVGWLYALIFNLPLFFVVRHKDGVDHCIEHWPKNRWRKRTQLRAFLCLVLFQWVLW